MQMAGDALYEILRSAVEVATETINKGCARAGNLSISRSSSEESIMSDTHSALWHARDRL